MRCCCLAKLYQSSGRVHGNSIGIALWQLLLCWLSVLVCVKIVFKNFNMVGKALSGDLSPDSALPTIFKILIMYAVSSCCLADD